MTKLPLGVALAALAAAVPAAAPAQRLTAPVIAVVDTNRIFRECTACRAAQTQLQAQVTALRTRQQTLQQQLQTQGQPIEQAVQALNGRQADAALQQRITAFQTQRTNAAQELGRTEQTLQSTQANVAQQINARLRPIITQVAQTRGATVALDASATLWNAATLDITNDVLAQLNQQLPSVSVTPLPQQQQQAPRPVTGRAEGAAPATLDIQRVMAALPHRYPMLLVDRVEELIPDRSIAAIKAVTINEGFFQGHFPGRPIMPGVLIVEALAQAAGVLAVESLGLAGSGKLVYFMAIDEAKFRVPVEPGVLLRLEVEFIQKRATVCKFAGRALVGGKLAAQANFTAMIADPPAS